MKIINIFKNPCKKCVIQPICSKYCYKHKRYNKFIIHPITIIICVSIPMSTILISTSLFLTNLISLISSIFGNEIKNIREYIIISSCVISLVVGVCIAEFFIKSYKNITEKIERIIIYDLKKKFRI